MKIGVYFTPNKSQGGVYQYCLALLESLEKIPNHHYTIISTSTDIPSKYSKHKRFTVIDMHTRSHELTLKTRDLISNTAAILTPKLINTLYKLNLFGLLTPIYRFTEGPQIKVIEEQNLDLVFYPTSSNLSFLTHSPAIVAIHDFAHRVNPQFKEVSAGGRWEHREYGFVNIAKKAFRVLVDSEIGKEDMINFYQSPAEQVVPLPFLPPSYLKPRLSSKKISQIKKSLNLPSKYLYYPAKFWPHKNHINIIKAIHLLAKRKIKINLILTGAKEADFSSYDRVMKLVKQYNLQNQVRYLGYVDSEQISTIYKLSEALIMPTAFGPTNIPVLEAWSLGTPVLYSDIRGCREQLGNAGLLINPTDPKDIAEKIQQIYGNTRLKKQLSIKGKIRLKKWTPADFTKRVKKIIQDFEQQ